MPLTAPEHRPQLPLEVLGSAEPVEVLYEAEEPVIFTLHTGLDQRVLAYLADATPEARWLLLAPCGDRLLEELRGGRVSVREALESSWLWLAKLDNDDCWTEAWSVDLRELPSAHLPEPGVMLLPEHEPALSMRAVGMQLGRDSTPASVVAYVANATRKALKFVAEFVLEHERQGRPSDRLRAFYDLPVHHFEFSSFEIAFSAPAEFAGDASLEHSIELLRHGIEWAASDDRRPLAADSDQEREAILRALEQLTPPSTGVIEGIEIGGRWMEHRAVKLRRSARRRVQEELRRAQAERRMSVTGRLREFDKDSLAFTLRDTPNGVDVRGSFDEELHDELLELFTNDDRVLVVGVERGGRLHVTGVSAVPEDAEILEPRG